jgi:hypothetical protein
MLPPWQHTHPVPPVVAETPTVQHSTESVTDAQRDAIDRAVHDLGVGSTIATAASLATLARREALDPQGYHPIAVLLRVASSLPPRTRSMGASQGGTIPPPPSPREAMERAVDGATELLARGDLRATRAWIDSALAVHGSADAYHPLVVLSRLVRTRAAVAGTPIGAVPRAHAGPPGDGRLPETIDGSEGVVLYMLGGAYGLSLGAWSAIQLSEPGGPDRGGLAVGGAVLGAAGGVLVAGLIGGRRDLRRGRVYAANAGFYLGLLAGLGVTSLPNGPARDATEREVATMMLAAGTVGLGVGIAVAHATDAHPGSASLVLSGGVWGAFVGGAFDRSFRETTPGAGGTGMLVGEALGVLTAFVSAHALKPTPSQTRWLDLGALLGGLGGTLLFSPVSDQTSSLAGALGCMAGGALGYVLGAPSPGERTTERERTPPAAALRLTFTPVRGGALLGVAL